MASLPVPVAPEAMDHLNGRQRSGSLQRKGIPQRLTFATGPYGNGRPNHGSQARQIQKIDDDAAWDNDFTTPPTSRFQSQDLNGTTAHQSHASQHNINHSHNSHPHSHPNSHSNSFSHGSLDMHDFPPTTALRPIQDTSDIHHQQGTIMAAITSLLMALPFVLSSLVQVSPFELSEVVQESGGGILLRPKTQSRYLSFLGVCSLTAATLVTVGFIGEVRSATNSRSFSKSQKTTRGKLLSYTSLKNIVERILSIGLPFYAASKLGGERVAIVILIALASDLASPKLRSGKAQFGNIWKILKTRKVTALALILQCTSDLLNLTTTLSPVQTLSGYLALATSAFILPWPFPSASMTAVHNHNEKDSNHGPGPVSWEGIATSSSSALISSPLDTELTVASGVVATIISFVVFVLSSQETQTLTLKLLISGSVVSIASTSSLLFADSHAILASITTVPLGFALVVSLFLQEIIDSHPPLPILFQSGIIVISWVGVYLDSSWLETRSHSHHHEHEASTSKLTKTILRNVEDYPLLHRIFSKKDSRRIVYFMTLNFSFMIIQGVYGFLTGSLGLLSDTVHMFFDCAALAVGLVATILGERQPSLEYPQGFKMIDSLAGFGNGVLLLAISIEIVYEAIERLASGSQLNRLGELLIVSTGGLVVNIFGLLAFGHHGHSHGHDHDHEHGDSHDCGHDHQHTHTPHDQDFSNLKNSSVSIPHDHKHDHADIQKPLYHHHNDSFSANEGLLLSPPPQTPLPTSTPTAPVISNDKHGLQDNHHDSHDHNHSHTNHNHNHGHGHGHHHHHHHGGSNMHGIYLHVLADMMGSISVIVSTVLVHYTGWAGWDAIASVAISFFIIQATIPLVKDTAKQLVLYIPESAEFDLREALSGVGQLRGVVNITVPRFWIESGKTSGVMHVVAAKNSDLDDVREQTLSYLKGRGMDVVVQVEREGEGRCWCGGSASAPTRNT